MGANAVTTVPVYTAGEVLTAADLNITNSGIPVFETSVERDAAFDGTGEKTLAEGQFAFLEDSNSTQYYDGAVWQSVGVAPGLVLISSTTIGTTVASVTVSSAFSATYDNYLITFTGGVGSTTSNLDMKLGSTTTGYKHNLIYAAYATGTILVDASATDTAFKYVGSSASNYIVGTCKIQNPFLTQLTTVQSDYSTLNESGTCTSILNNTTSYTEFTVLTQAGTLTGGTIRVYGYANS